MAKIIKTTFVTTPKSICYIKSYFDSGIVKTFAKIGNHIKLIDESLYSPKDLKN